jgi:two-component system sensor histidine kinase and response regulator WspE
MMDLFREEVRAHAAVLNQGLIDLENFPTSPQKIEPLMRAAHSIKGAARIVNIGPAVQLAHTMEDAFVAAQEGRTRLTASDIDVLLRGADVLAGLSLVSEANAATWSVDHAAEIHELTKRFRFMAQGQSADLAAPGTLKQEASTAWPGTPRDIVIPREPFLSGDDYTMVDVFREEIRSAALALHEGLVCQGIEPFDKAKVEGLARVARSISGAARILDVEPIVQLGDALEAAIGAMPGFPKEVVAVAPDVLLEVVAFLADLIHVSAEDLSGWLAQRAAQVQELCERVQGLIGKQQCGPEPALPTGSTAALFEAVTASPREAPAADEEKSSAPAAEAFVRVAAQNLNRLMGLAGESLVLGRWLDPFSIALLKLKKEHDYLALVLESLVQTLATGRRQDQIANLVAEARRQGVYCREVLSERLREFQDHASQAEDLNSRLYREVIASRMRPFADGAHGFPRLVRDMARQLNKQVYLQIEGQSTEVDRDILERLEAPLTHLLRNAVDHGIELPEARKAAGKPEVGLIRIQARHQAGMLALTVADDGSGIDLERLRTKVVERRLTTTEIARNFSEPELLDFLFLPGFSTAGALTEYSGRGVGLDVVQTMVRKMGGSVRISTQPGRGTSFHLQLPITLSVLRAVLVDIAGETYAFPHNRIDRLLRVPTTEVRSLEQRQFITIDEENVGLVLAAQLLDLPATPPAGGELPVLLLSDVTGHYGLLVEAFRGEQDLVVRPLDPRLGRVPNISAAAILDDGSPVLIVDVEDLIRSMDQFIQANRLRRFAQREEGARPSKRVLVVDDSITVRELERQLLRNHGYEVVVAVDGKDGWNSLRAEPFDLVVTDVDMPRMNGLELVQAMRNDAALRNLPVIIVSYKERQEDRLRGLEVGANYYLTKGSFHDDTFLQAVTDLIGEA